MAMAMSPTYAGYPMSGTSVVPVGPVATPMMMLPSYGLPAYSPMAVYSTNTPAPGTEPVGPAARPKPLTEEVISSTFNTLLTCLPFIFSIGNQGN